MNENLRKIVYLVGIIAILYFAIRYLLPLVVGLLGIFLKMFLYVLLIAMAVLLVLYFISFVMRKVNGE